MFDTSVEIKHYPLQLYAVPALLCVATIPLWVHAGALYAAGSIAVAVLSLMLVRDLLNRLEHASRRSRTLDEELHRCRRLSTTDDLSAGIAHEINNPLAIIAQETQWVRHIIEGAAFKDHSQTGDCLDSLREISSQVDRCKEIVQKLLSLAREMQPVCQFVDLNHLIDNMTGLVERETRTKNVRIVRRLSGHLPRVYTDPPLVRQVVLNLLFNAIQAIEQDGTVTIATEAKHGSVEITVEDTGCGIAKDQLPKIFTPFFSTKPPGKGTGLGLAICRGITERLGGYISVTSDVGKCTTFTIHLPIAGPAQGE
jgi:two-component system, NtrC family, sensor kinase